MASSNFDVARERALYLQGRKEDLEAEMVRSFGLDAFFTLIMPLQDAYQSQIVAVSTLDGHTGHN
jgi:hypothetical protein